MTQAIGDAKGIDLNSASAEQLDRVGGLGQDRVRRLMHNRPFRSWDDLRRVEGFGGTLVDDLRKAGATIGDQR
jgi:DNA uptake protein ComE-like DNA-binding protein